MFSIAAPVVKIGQEVPELSPGTPKMVSLHSLAPILLSSCQNFGLWLRELCSKGLNRETVSKIDRD